MRVHIYNVDGYVKISEGPLWDQIIQYGYIIIRNYKAMVIMNSLRALRSSLLYRLLVILALNLDSYH